MPPTADCVAASIRKTRLRARATVPPPSREARTHATGDQTGGELRGCRDRWRRPECKGPRAARSLSQTRPCGLGQQRHAACVAQSRRWPSPAVLSPAWPPAPGGGKLKFPSSGFVVHPRAKQSRAPLECNTRVAPRRTRPRPEPTQALWVGGGDTSTEKSHCHLQRGCNSAAARPFPRYTHFPHTLTFGLPPIPSPIKTRTSNTSVQRNPESAEHEDRAPRNAISKTKLPVCLCMGRTEGGGGGKGRKEKSQKKRSLAQFLHHLPG